MARIKWHVVRVPPKGGRSQDSGVSSQVPGSESLGRASLVRRSPKGVDGCVANFEKIMNYEN
ncbi:MAG: hypothetical protein PF904_14945 [Kiritimatiellae bacterium]|nr:hypothetical protein [Kiritimatiellia bacterium]